MGIRSPAIMHLRASFLFSPLSILPERMFVCGKSLCQGHSALVPAQRLSTVGVSRPRQPTLQEDSTRLSLYE